MIFSIIKVFILSLVEGLTEFVPVSSTGHMILVDQFLKLSDNKVFVDAFKIIIQLGAILSVVVYYWKKIFPFAKGNTKQESMDIIAMWVKIVIAVIPAVILGLKFDDIIEEKFFNSLTVSIMLVFYGILLIWIETRKKKEEKIKSIKEMTIPLALGVGLFQDMRLEDLRLESLEKICIEF